MNPNLTNASVPKADFMGLSASGASGNSADTGSVYGDGMKRAHHATGMQHSPSPLGLKSAYVAFAATVFACVVAAATVASHNVPLLIGGF